MNGIEVELIIIIYYSLGRKMIQVGTIEHLTLFQKSQSLL